MAVATANRINRFLDLPVTIVTNSASLPLVNDYSFDRVITVEADSTNVRERQIWFNKGRYQAYALSPYDETLLLDTDYLVNSPLLLKTFDLNDFCCHDTTSYLGHPGVPQEFLSPYSLRTMWATVITFKKTRRAKQIFDCLGMVQKNYDHYANIHNFVGGVFRNDYALTLAVRIANGHTNNPRDIIPWNLVHLSTNVTAYRQSDTEYMVMVDVWKNSKIKKEYFILKDTDFHCMDKKLFMELV
jgi:hypothetical protein